MNKDCHFSTRPSEINFQNYQTRPVGISMLRFGKLLHVYFAVIMRLFACLNFLFFLDKVHDR